MANRFNSLKRPRVERTGPLPEAAPVTGLPVLYLVSGRALNPQGRRPAPLSRGYRAVFDAFDTGPGPVALAAIEGAGPYDYQDFPVTHPVVSFLRPGLKDTVKSINPVSDTAAVIGNFAVYLLEREEQRRNSLLTEFFFNTDAESEPEFPELVREFNIPPRQPVSGSLHVQSRGLPGFRLHP